MHGCLWLRSTYTAIDWIINVAPLCIYPQMLACWLLMCLHDICLCQHTPGRVSETSRVEHTGAHQGAIGSTNTRARRGVHQRSRAMVGSPPFPWHCGIALTASASGDQRPQQADCRWDLEMLRFAQIRTDSRGIRKVFARYSRGIRTIRKAFAAFYVYVRILFTQICTVFTGFTPVPTCE